MKEKKSHSSETKKSVSKISQELRPYADPKLTNEKNKGHFFRNVMIIVAIVFAIGIAGLVKQNDENHKKQLAIAAEQARLAADPITQAGIFNVVNKLRAGSGATALSMQNNLVTAAKLKCDDMVAGKYFAYKNPVSGKESNSYIADNKGDLYVTYYVSTMFPGDAYKQTATDVVSSAIKNDTNILDAKYNSVGWAVCDSPVSQGVKYIVGMYANVGQKPASSSTSSYSGSARTYTPLPSLPKTTNCYTNYNPGVMDNYGNYILKPSSSTSCY